MARGEKKKRNAKLFVWLAVAAAALAVLMFVFLMASAGRRAPEGIVTPAWTEKIPFDVFTVVIAVLVVMCVTAGANLALETAPDRQAIHEIGLHAVSE